MGKPTIPLIPAVSATVRRERDEPREHMESVKTGEREEGGPEEGAAGTDPLPEKPRVLAALAEEEDRAQDDRGSEPAATLGPRRKGHGRAAPKESDGKDRGPAYVESG